MSVALLVVGICGVVLASLSLGWQAANYVLTGGRVKVRLRVGGLGNGGWSPRPRIASGRTGGNLASQGFPQPIVAVMVANVGRQPVTVARWGLRSGLGMSLYPAADSIGPRLPHRLEVGESETWAVDLAPVHAFIQATRETLEKPQPESGSPKSMFGGIEARMAAQKDDIVGVAELAASVVVPAAQCGGVVWSGHGGSVRGRGFDCSGLRVARWVADRCLRASFCVARRCSPSAFSLVTPHRCWSAEVPGLHGMQEVSGSSPLSSTSRYIRSSRTRRASEPASGASRPLCQSGCSSVLLVQVRVLRRLVSDFLRVPQLGLGC
jgi:hypothetical protein